MQLGHQAHRQVKLLTPGPGCLSGCSRMASSQGGQAVPLRGWQQGLGRLGSRQVIRTLPGEALAGAALEQTCTSGAAAAWMRRAWGIGKMVVLALQTAHYICVARVLESHMAQSRKGAETTSFTVHVHVLARVSLSKRNRAVGAATYTDRYAGPCMLSSNNLKTRTKHAVLKKSQSKIALHVTRDKVMTPCLQSDHPFRQTTPCLFKACLLSTRSKDRLPTKQKDGWQQMVTNRTDSYASADSENDSLSPCGHPEQARA